MAEKLVPSSLEQFLSGRYGRYADRLRVKKIDQVDVVETTCLEVFTVLGMHSDTWGARNEGGYWTVKCSLDNDTRYDLVLKVRMTAEDGWREESFFQLATRLA